MRRHNPARRDGGRRLHGAGGDRRPNDVPHREGGGAPAELGEYGIGFVTLASGGIPESLPEGFEDREEIVD